VGGDEGRLAGAGLGAFAAEEGGEVAEHEGVWRDAAPAAAAAVVAGGLMKG
jgi:hypothetical protein